MNNEQQQVRARKNCGKLYRKLLNECDLIMDDEKYFKLTGNNVLGNRYFYSTDPATAPPKVNFQCKTKFEAKVMIWMAMSSKDRGCWEEAPSYVPRCTIFSCLNTIFCSTCHALSNKKEFSFSSSKMVEL